MLIVGTGAVASWLSHRLTLAGIALQHFGSPSKRLGNLAENTFGYRCRDCTKGSEVEAHDVWLIATKVGQNPAKVRELAKAPMPSVILVLQNGFEADSEWLKLGVPVERGVLTYGVASVGPGRYRGGHRGEIVLSRSTSLAKVLRDAGIEVRESSDIAAELWLKLAVNASLNVVCSLLSLTNGEAWEGSDSRKLILEAVEEVTVLAQNLGVDVSKERAFKTVAMVARQTSSNVCSTLSDLRSGRQSEYRFINGALLEEAKRIGLDLPTLSRLDEAFCRIEPITPLRRAWVPIPKLRALSLSHSPSPLPVFQGLDLRLEAQS